MASVALEDEELEKEEEEEEDELESTSLGAEVVTSTVSGASGGVLLLSLEAMMEGARRRA